jgi:hypothetical protein
MALKPKQQIVIDALIKLITEGKSYSEVLKVNKEKWRLAQSTFESRWRNALKQYQEKQGIVQTKVMEKTIDKEISMAEIQLNRIKEIDDDLYKMFKGQIKIIQRRPVVVDKEIQLIPVENGASMSEVVSIAQTIYKRFGSNAPIKSETELKISEPDINIYIDGKKLTGKL